MESNTPLPAPPLMPSKPGLVQAIAIMTLVNGILNILWGLGVTFGFAVSIVGLCITPLTILPGVLGIFEILYATRLLAENPRGVRPDQTIAILEIACIAAGNVLSAVVGILALVFYNDEQVRGYFARINA